MKNWLMKALLMSLALFFTYTYFYQHAMKEMPAQAASAPVSQQVADHQDQPAVSQSSSSVTKPAAEQLWKTDQQVNPGVIPRLTHGVESGLSMLIQQGVVIVASLVNVFMNLFL